MDSDFIKSWHTLLATSHCHGQMIPRCLSLFCYTLLKSPISKALLPLHFFVSLLSLVSTRPYAQVTSRLHPFVNALLCPNSYAHRIFLASQIFPELLHVFQSFIAWALSPKLQYPKHPGLPTVLNRSPPHPAALRHALHPELHCPAHGYPPEACYTGNIQIRPTFPIPATPTQEHPEDLRPA